MEELDRQHHKEASARDQHRALLHASMEKKRMMRVLKEKKEKDAAKLKKLKKLHAKPVVRARVP